LEGVTIKGDGASMLGKLMREQHDNRSDGTPAGVQKWVEANVIPTLTDAVEQHEWKDISRAVGGHNGEYDYECVKCGVTNWLPRYGDITHLPQGPCYPRKK
jgi:hypothetical protein